MVDYSRLESPSRKDPEWLPRRHAVEREELLESNAGIYRSSRWSWLNHHRRTIVIHVIFLVANLFVLTAYASGWLTLRYLQDPHYNTPFRNTISYEDRPFDLQPIYLDKDTPNPSKTNDFNGPPRQELDNAWSTLMQYQNVRLHKEELGQFSEDDSIVQLADGTGYWITVSVFHGLHCIERLHHFLYSETYYPGLSEDDTFTLKLHTERPEHCLDWLRHYVQCNADTTLIPIQWTAESPGPVATDPGTHQCVVWDPIYEWMASHSFNPSQPGLLIHPILDKILRAATYSSACDSVWMHYSLLPDNRATCNPFEERHS
ncbi:Hypothetical protein TPAR_09138 [Tolypocladium paradoxum]|uniref:Uncharacterized protein n=1 Tax=Tolypocladium paradoxum TaxID=94208 RepID=A0A2S4L2F7_9HYPO|nr:Hypothetical protein TPAR_09138 [Tolypocladium paradoxum]